MTGLTEWRAPSFTLEKTPYDQLEAMLRAGDSLGEGYFFDHYRIESIGMEVDRLRYSRLGIVEIELRQATNQAEGLHKRLPHESRNTRPEPFSKDVRVDLTTLHPGLTLGLQHEDGHRSSSIKSSWRFTPEGRMKWDMAGPDESDHGPLNKETKLNHLELILGSAALSDSMPNFFLLRTADDRLANL